MDGSKIDTLSVESTEHPSNEDASAETGIKLDLSKLESAVQKLETMQAWTKRLTIAAATIFLFLFAAIYSLNRPLFFDMVALAWSWQSAVVLIIAAIVAKIIVTQQAVTFVKTSIEVGHEIGKGFNVILGAFRAERERSKGGEKKQPDRPVARDGDAEQDQRVAALEARLKAAADKAAEDQRVLAARVREAQQNERVARQNAEALAKREQRNREEVEQEALQNWGELSALWSDVWEWTKGILDEALLYDTRGVVLGNLRRVNKKSPREVAEALLRYGYLDDQEAALIIQMVGIFNSYKLRQASTDAGALKGFKKLYSQWKNI